jgi:hypothetical protein
VGRISRSRCTSHLAAIASNRILAAFGSRLLASAPIAISRSVGRHSYPTDGSGVLADATIMGICTSKAGAAALWIASVEDTAASTYDFLATHGKTNVII